jgi:hypothetical protein
LFSISEASDEIEVPVQWAMLDRRWQNKISGMPTRMAYVIVRTFMGSDFRIDSTF